MLPQAPSPTSCEYRFTTVPQTTRNLLKFQGMSPGLPEAALSHAKSGEDWSPFTSTCDAMQCDAMQATIRFSWIFLSVSCDVNFTRRVFACSLFCGIDNHARRVANITTGEERKASRKR